MQAGWKQKVLLPLLAVFGIVAASVVWKWLEDWQVKPQLPVNQLEIGWAELLKTAIPRGAVLQYLTPAEDTFPTWGEVLERNVCFYRAYEAAPLTMLTPQDTDDDLQEMLTGQRTPMDSRAKKHSVPSDTTRQNTPASAFALGRQVRIGAHGLA